MHSVKWPRHIYAVSINNLQKMDHFISFEELFKNILGRQSENPKCFDLLFSDTRHFHFTICFGENAAFLRRKWSDDKRRGNAHSSISCVGSDGGSGVRVGGARSGLRWRGVQLGWWGAGGVGGRTAD